MISVLRTPNYTPAVIERAVERHFDLLALQSLIPKGGTVVIKPNLLMKRSPEEGTTTHPSLVEAVARQAKALGAGRVIIADSPGGVYNEKALEGIYRATKMEEAAKKSGAALNYDCSSVHMALPDGKICKGFEIIAPVAQADLVISVGKLKSHCMTGLSGGVKNLFGCVPGLLKPELHFRYPEEKDFSSMLIDLSRTVRPGITLIDAVVSMEGDGPSSGQLRETGFTYCCDSPYEMDLLLAMVIGRDPKELPTVQEAIKRGLCPPSPKEGTLVGDPPEVFANFKMPRSKTVDFTGNLPAPLRGIAGGLARAFLSPRPQILPSKCVGCGKCAESCPAHTIQVREGKAILIRAKCIKCYCCHEMCPVHAIRVKRNRLLDL